MLSKARKLSKSSTGTAEHVAKLFWSRVLRPVRVEVSRMQHWMDRKDGADFCKLPARDPKSVAEEHLRTLYFSLNFGIYGGYGFDMLPEDGAEYMDEDWWERRADCLTLRANIFRLQRVYKPLLKNR